MNRYRSDPKRREYMRKWAANQHKRYADLKVLLIVLLGGRCAIKGCMNTDLTLDHHRGRDWQLYDHALHGRVKIYLEEAKHGKLRVLCSACNSRHRPSLLKDVPF